MHPDIPVEERSANRDRLMGDMMEEAGGGRGGDRDSRRGKGSNRGPGGGRERRNSRWEEASYRREGAVGFSRGDVEKANDGRRREGQLARKDGDQEDVSRLGGGIDNAEYDQPRPGDRIVTESYTREPEGGVLFGDRCAVMKD